MAPLPGEPSPDQPPAPRTTRTIIHTCGEEVTFDQVLSQGEAPDKPETVK